MLSRLRKSILKKEILIILFIYLLIYLPYLSATVFGGDSAELVNTSINFGIAHPPGYPFYTLVNNVFVRLFPFGNYYQKISFLNSLYTLLTTIILFFILYQLLNDSLISLLSSLFFMILFPVWLYSVVPEVFSLSILLISLQIFLLFKLQKIKEKSSQPARLLKSIFYFSLGLSVSHHHLFIFFLPGYSWFIFHYKNLKKILSQNKLNNLLFFLLGLSFYLYPVIISFYNASTDIENAKTLSGFLRLITRSSYGTFKAFAWSGGDIVNRFYDLFSLIIFIIHDFKPLGIFFIILGIIYLYKSQKKIFKFFLIHLISICFFFFYTNFFLGYSFTLGTYERFLFFLYLILIIFFAYGLFFFRKFSNKKIKEIIQNQFIKKLLYFFPIILFIGYFIINYLSSFKVIKNIKFLDIFENFGKDILATPDKKSIVFLTGDNSLFISQNLQSVKKIRADLLIITPEYLNRSHLRNFLIQKNVLLPQSLSNNNKLLETVLKINFNHERFIYSDRPFSEGIWVPYGLLWKYFPDYGTYKNEELKIINKNKNLWKKYSYPLLNKETKSILFTNDITSYYNRQLWSTINYFTVTNNLEEAKKLTLKFFNKLNNDYYFLITFVNLANLENNCSENVNKVVNKILKLNIISSYDYIPIINFYKRCNVDDKKLNKIIEDYLKLKEIEDISLKSL